MGKKNKKPDTLDTETTFADMNVEGFSWYNPNLKKGNNGKRREKLTRREYRQMVKGAFLAYLPVFLIVICVFGIMALIGWLWVS